jgi:cellulose synthase/poly-beta-1,6-N-acetylglucosamine synthase-like glycosyltransferase
MNALQIIFWLSLALILWTYLGYGLFLKMLSSHRPQPNYKPDYYPSVSMIITAHNEESRIAEKIENCLRLDYPKELLEIIVVSDGSTDRTTEIMSGYTSSGIILLAIPERHGKHAGQGRGIEIARGEIIVLTDATTFLENDGIKKIVRSFADPQIGCVSGLDKIINDGTFSSGEGFYVQYLMKIREWESRLNSLIGISGCFCAVRKNLCNHWNGLLSSDFYLPVMSYMRGFRSVLDQEALGYYRVIDDHKREFHRKVRTLVHGVDVLFHLKEALNPFRYGLFSLQILSHKLIRWLVPFFMIFLFLSNLLLVGSNLLYSIAFVLQLIFYFAVLFSFLVKRLQKFVIFKMTYFFFLANLSIIVAWYEYMAGRRYVWWEPTKR